MPQGLLINIALMYVFVFVYVCKHGHVLELDNVRAYAQKRSTVPVVTHFACPWDKSKFFSVHSTFHTLCVCMCVYSRGRASACVCVHSYAPIGTSNEALGISLAPEFCADSKFTSNPCPGTHCF